MFSTPQRKAEHLEIVVSEDVDFKVSTGFDDVFFIHNALPQCQLEEISPEVSVFGKRLSAPIIIASMTGGHPASYQINAQLAQLAEELQIGFSLGSQRAALEDPRLEYTYRVAREKAPTTLVLGNIGISQLRENPVEVAEKLIEMVDADALAIHLNPLQEVLQLEGEAKCLNALELIRLLAKELKKPIIVKETGCGLSGEVAEKLAQAGVAGLDVGGSGGTSWAAVEFYRAVRAGELNRAEACKTFWNWGIPTAISICEARKGAGENVIIIATGGIRNGLHIAKALALGADLAGIAAPVLKVLVKEGVKRAKDYLERLTYELKISMFLTEARDVKELKTKPLILSGLVGGWVKARKLKRNNFLIPSEQ
ncbi:MAG: type 2 isopentenyl-diphosphate Delta-isomerase [Candidatus Methanomethylicota archaeon]|uniref:Isopentenyl-diphosphate delta-isomerase n=1 Tax=Thermoproteota archaeon TaxID=2056631 RepID=A0A497ETW9_9CREN|nr:MAG: type 2 isopentenyl-diphosphate Delta-isomerase [Candidatus Verstraetearchaeota archaeon]